MPLTPEQIETIKAKDRDLEFFAANFLRFAPRAGGARIPAVFSRPQRVLHALLQRELLTHGMIRALIPKARQMGVSTYVGSRFFHAAVTNPGIRCNVAAHLASIATKLFQDVKLSYDDLPPWKRPPLTASNARELVFARLNSVYKVMTANSDNVGRGDNFQRLHVSEAAYVEDAEDMSSGLFKTVHNEPGTEILLESTGNGQSGLFYNMCMQAHAEGNRGPWRVHFLPWTLMESYASMPWLIPDSWTPSREFIEYGNLHRLTREQLHWFHVQNHGIAIMNGGTPDKIHRLTRQEYPVVFQECFTADSTFDFFPPSLVQTARSNKPVFDSAAPSILMIDAATEGKDPCFVGDRQGRTIGGRVWGELKIGDQNVQADWIVNAVDRFKFRVVTVDTTGLGIGLFSALKLRLGDRVLLVPVNFGSGATEPSKHGNKRVEIIARFRNFLDIEGACLPNDEKLTEELAAFKWGQGSVRRDDKGVLWMPPKEKLKAVLHRSTDRLDTCALSFAIDDRMLLQADR